MMYSGKRILFIHPFIYKFARGIERYTMNLAPALVREGMDVSILTWRMPDPVRWSEEAENVQIIPVPVSRYFSPWTAFPLYIKHVLRNRYDHIFVHFADYGESQMLGFLRFLRESVPYSVVLHFPYSQVPHRYHTLESKRIFKHATHVVAVSSFVAEEARAFVRDEPVVISHGVDAVRYCPDPSARVRLATTFGLVHDARFILTVSALEERKGVQWVLRALPDIFKSHPELYYIVVGDGPYRQTLEVLAKELSIVDHVFFAGADTDTVRFNQAAELMLILSRGEASSLVTLESLACGTPVIASKHRPFDELILPSWGLQVDEENTEELVRAVTELLSDGDRRRAMGIAGRDYILREHTWEQIAAQYLNLVLS